jgi:phage virion morphogenesis protein
MSGASVTIDATFQDAAVQDMLGQLAAAADDLTYVMDLIGAHLQQTVAERFDEGHGPAGVPWKPSGRAKFAGGKTMVDSGRLMGSITRQADANSVTVGTNVIYGRIHQFGGVISAKTAKGLSFNGWSANGTPGHFLRKSVTIPARPFLGVDAEDETEILAIVTGKLAEITGGAPA